GTRYPRPVVEDGGANEHHQHRLVAAAAAALEQVAEHRDAAEHRHLAVVTGEGFVDQAAEHQKLAVPHHHVGGDHPLGGDHVGGAGGGGGGQQVRGLLLDGHAHHLAVVDLGQHLELDAHLFPLDGLEGVVDGIVGGHIAAGDERHLLAHRD